VRRRTRTILATVALAAVAAFAGIAALGLPGPDEPHGEGQRAAEILAKDRSVANAVNGITYDLRATDTFGEELIMLVAALGVATLLRTSRPDRGGEEDPAVEDRRTRTPIAGSLRLAGAVLVAPVIVLGCYVVTHGALTPGGGFQGGIVLAATLLLVYAAGQAFAVERVHPVSAVEVVEAVGALAFALVGVAGLVAAGSLFANVIGLAPMGSLLSGGTVPVLSVATGVEVAGALALILTELLDQTLVRTSS